MAQLLLERVVHEYRRGSQLVRALGGVSLTIESGQLVSIVGPSGAGKSTLLHLMGALDIPTSGRVVLDGQELQSLDDDRLADIRRQTVGFIFQFFNLLPMLSAWENVAVPGLLGGTPLGQLHEPAVRLLERVGLAGRVDHRPHELSGGQLQRVAIARSLLMEPSVVLADEPTGSVDSETGTEILELLSDIAHEGGERAVVLVTHNLEVARCTDRTLLLIDGTIRADGPPREVLSKVTGDECRARR